MINFHIQPLIVYLSFSCMSNKNTLTLFSPVVLWGDISSQSETGLYNLKCLNVQERPTSQMILIIDIFSYKTAKFDECRPTTN